MITGEFRTSISQLESELSNSRKKLDKKFHKLKTDFQQLQKYIVEKNEQIAQLKEQKKDLLSLLDQAFAIIDDPSQAKLFEDLRDVESLVETLIGIAKSKEQTAIDNKLGDGTDSIKLTTSKGSNVEPGEQAKNWAKDVLKDVGRVSGATAASSSKT